MNPLSNPILGRLFIAQALFWTSAMTGITLTALIGLQLAPSNALATLPMALLVVGNLLAVRPLSQLMQRHGRRSGFLLGATAGIAGGLISAWGVWLGDFMLLCLGALPLGLYQASANYYRFAALEAVDDAHKGQATAWVIGGGLCAALIAPTLGDLSRNALAVPFTGAYVLIAGVAFFALLTLSGLRTTPAPVASTASPAGTTRTLLARPIVRTAILTTAVGHGLMILVMNATPLAMSFCGLGVVDSTRVIQWHLIGMFLPAFIAGPLVDRLGSHRVGLIGALMLLVSAAVALVSQQMAGFLISSCLLGIGWNLMLVAGTTLLGSGHAPSERASAQGLMELCNGSVAATMSLASGALITGIGWNAVNIGMTLLAGIAVATLLLRRGPAASRVRAP
ncbi:MFS transporter [Stutzerimonas azotifigens]|uniref:MFS transporter n=1 Tax=Stutzerimonas azotifigens TaxID=291995 RepID=A0ABR5Z1V4_9GAMM|nr:MFS transporter [Stutzerimonas azotifigens]MBA1274155.1 MFS transporter [Stutzerimonas azotifigens]